MKKTLSDDNEKFLWRFFLGTGFREAEVLVAEVTDENLDTKTIRVEEKPYFGFMFRRIKAGESEPEEITVQPELVVQRIHLRSAAGNAGRSPSTHARRRNLYSLRVGGL